MSRRSRRSAALLALGLVLGPVACGNDGGSTIGPAPSTTVAPGPAVSKADGEAAAATSTSTSTPGTVATKARDVGTCASITAPDLTGLGVEGLTVGAVQDVSDVLQGPARGGTGCWFSLTKDGTGTASLTVLAHPDGVAYFDSKVARLTDAEPVPGLGDDARVGIGTPGSTHVITRRGTLVVDVEIGRPDVIDRNLLIAIAGLALEREDRT